jgi:hypothetical protein
VGEPGETPPAPSTALHGARPNPFNPRAELYFSVLEPAHVLLEVYDLKGRLVGRLVDGPMVAGTHSVPFGDQRLASGTYLARLQVGDEVRTCKMTLAK